MSIYVPGHGMYLSHRLVWALHHGDPGSLTVDHKDTDRTNSRIDNLRLATKGQQMYNQPAPRHNTSGVKGLSPHKNGGWNGEIKFKRKRYTKYSTDRAEVEAWLVATRRQLHGDFAHD